MIGRRGPTLAATFLLVAGSLPARDTAREAIAKWQPGKRIEIVFNSGERLTGRLGPIETDRFTFVSDKGLPAERLVRFDEVQAIRGKMTTRMKWVIAGLVYVAVVLVGRAAGCC